MTKRRIFFHSLRARTIAVLLFASLAAIVSWFAVSRLSDWSVDRWYLSERAQHRRNDAVAELLQEQLNRKPISAGDSSVLQKWAVKREFVTLVVFLPGAPYEVDPWATTDLQPAADLPWNLSRQDFDFYQMQFTDGEFTVAVSETSELRLYQIGGYLALAAAFTVLMLILLTHSRWLTKRIRVLSGEVNAVSHGELEHEIVPIYDDEISSLAQDVEHMRSTIIQRTRSEQSALQANSELITALSHDIRNPLTALIGYLELLEMDLESLPETDRDYVRACLDKSYRIRDLTGELFRYFLVYTREAQTAELEDYDAQELLYQLLGECCEVLISQGFRLENTVLEQPCTLRTDVSLLKRVVGNLESNIIKYADPAEPVRIEARRDGGKLILRFENRVAAVRPGAVESNHVGLRTCSAIMSLLGGRFSAEENDGTFIADCFLPIKE